MDGWMEGRKEGRKEEREGGIAQKVGTTKKVSGFKGTQSLCTYSSGLPIMRASKRLRIDRKGTEPGPAERKTAPPRPFPRPLLCSFTHSCIKLTKRLSRKGLLAV